jgi:hypothetical protein
VPDGSTPSGRFLPATCIVCAPGFALIKYFGFDAKAQTSIDAILEYDPTIPSWGYNGGARRYWDFGYYQLVEPLKTGPLQRK